MVDLSEQTPPSETPPPPLKKQATASSNNSTQDSAALQDSLKVGKPCRVTRSSAKKKDTRVEPVVESGAPALKIVAPQTPASTTMDSDDDFRSVASSDAFEAEDRDSDASIDAG